MFCPSMFGTAFVEHFFGLSRMILPNFTFGQFITLIKHTSLQQRLLSSSDFASRKERRSRSGYPNDFDTRPLTPAELQERRASITSAQIDASFDHAFTEIRISAKRLGMGIPSTPLTLAPFSEPVAPPKLPPSFSGSRERDESAALDDSRSQTTNLTTSTSSGMERTLSFQREPTSSLRLLHARLR